MKTINKFKDSAKFFNISALKGIRIQSQILDFCGKIYSLFPGTDMTILRP